MSFHTIREIIGTAVIDQGFCHALVAGDRAALLAAYDLLPAERQMLLDIQADGLAAFAQQVYERITMAQQAPTLRSVQAGTSAHHTSAAHIKCRPQI